MKKITILSFIAVLVFGTILPPSAIVFASESVADQDAVSEDVAEGAGSQEPTEATEEANETKEETEQDSQDTSKEEVAKPVEKEIDRLAEIKSADVRIYETIGDEDSTEKATDKQLDQSFFASKEAEYEEVTYYFLTTSIDDSATEEDEIGWVKKSDVNSKAHKTVSEEEQTLYFTGDEGKAYTEHAWSGEANELDKPLSELKDEPFNVTVTEKVDETTWYGGSVEGIDEVIWVEAKFVTTEEPESDSTEEAADDQDAAKEEATTDESKDDEAVTESEETEQDSDEQADEANANEEESADDKEDAEKDQVTEENELDDEDKEAQDQADEDKQAIEEQEAEEDASDDEDQAANESKEERATKVAPRIALFSQSRAAAKPVESKTSRLGHIRGGTHYIYKTLGNESTKFSSAPYQNAVYYIKKQAKYNGKTYYLLSENPSSTSGVVGWMASGDLSTHAHKTVNKTKKVFTVKGNGKSYTKAWGGSKDHVYNLSSQKGKMFYVNLTETVGSNTWYRGTLSGKTTWIHSSYLNTSNTSSVKTSKTSRLGHIRGGTRYIYDKLSLGSTWRTAGAADRDRVYYIKKQGTLDGKTYYLISTNASSTSGVVGWVEAKDLSTNTHTTSNRNKFRWYVKGTGKAYSKAWGGEKDKVYNLSSQKGMPFDIHMTEKVGSNNWYRGTLNGKTVFIHGAYLEKRTFKYSNTSKLGHIKSASRKIYEDMSVEKTAKNAGSANTNRVYYIKQQAVYNGTTFYLISRKPSKTSGTIGWVKASDMNVHTHVGVDKKKKEATIKGTGNAYAHAWGGNKDLVYKLSTKKGKKFNIHLTEKVGNNTWYRGSLDGKTVWIHSSYLNTVKQTGATKKVTSGSTSYNMTLNQFVNMQMKVNPQTDKGGKGWRTATKSEVLYYLNPANFLGSLKDKLQFADLSQSSNVSASEVNQKILAGNGVLAGKASSFINASKTYGVNEIYLISHAKLETGNGTSTLATGVKYNGKTVYNVYGIGAVDSNPINGGAKFAYEQGWTTVDKAIVGGAKFVGQNYVNAGQSTLYQMRWNPAAAANYGYASHQYASDIGWAAKQTSTMNSLYGLLTSYNIKLNIPKFK